MGVDTHSQRRTGQGPKLTGILLLAAWSWLVLSTLLSWYLNPLRPVGAELELASSYWQVHLLHLAGLLLFAVLSRRHAPPGPGPALVWWLIGVGYVLAYRAFGPNELAGILLFFIPWAVASAMSDPLVEHRAQGAPSWRAVSLCVALLFLGMLYQTTSRSGLGACALALAPMLWCLGRRGRRSVQMAAAVGVLWLLGGGLRSFLEFFVFDDKSQRLTVYTFLTGRPHIWLRYAQGVRDMPLTGMGLGASERVVGTLYPLSRFEPRVRVEDAHNFFLQIASELGVISLLAVLALLAVAVRRLYSQWQQAPTGPQRARVLGIAAGLLAYLIYGTVDVVAFGQIGSLPFWCLLGLACQPVPSAGPSTVATTISAWRRPSRWQALALGLAIAMGFPWLLHHPLASNLAALETANVLLAAPGRNAVVSQRLSHLAETWCHGHYFIARLATVQGLNTERDDAYRSLLGCSDDFDDIIAHLLPDHTALADEAIRRHPNSAAAHLWRARQLATGSPEQRLQAETHFQIALHLAPDDGRAWVELGNLLYHRDRNQALDAYGEACRRGDYYGQGCWLAGATALELGKLETAIQYYRSSRMPGSQAFAQGLETHRLRQPPKSATHP